MCSMVHPGPQPCCNSVRTTFYHLTELKVRRSLPLRSLAALLHSAQLQRQEGFYGSNGRLMTCCWWFSQVHRQRVCSEDHQQGQVCWKGLAFISPFSNSCNTFLLIQQNHSTVTKATHLDAWCFQEHLIENEVSVLRQVKHPNIIMLIEEVDTSSELYLVMELVKVRLTLKRVNEGKRLFS